MIGDQTYAVRRDSGAINEETDSALFRILIRVSRVDRWLFLPIRQEAEPL